MISTLFFRLGILRVQAFQHPPTHPISTADMIVFLHLLVSRHIKVNIALANKIIDKFLAWSRDIYPVNPVSMHFNREYILNINWVKYMSHVTIIFNLSLRNEQMVISLENIWTEPKDEPKKKKHILPTRKHIQLGSRFYRSTRRPPRRDDPLWEMSTRFCIILRQETGRKVKGHFHRSKIGSMSNGFVCTYILPIISSDQGSPDGPSPRW